MSPEHSEREASLRSFWAEMTAYATSSKACYSFLRDILIGFSL